MKKAETEMRAAYKRSDFAKLERGKFFAEASKGTAVALIEPQLAKAFPTYGSGQRGAARLACAGR